MSSTSILSENFTYRNATYALGVRYAKEGLLLTVEQTVHHLNGTKEEASITMPTAVLDRLNELLDRVSELPQKESAEGGKGRAVPLKERPKLAKAYLQGVSINNLSRSYGHSAEAITAMLKRAGLYVYEQP